MTSEERRETALKRNTALSGEGELTPGTDFKGQVVDRAVLLPAQILQAAWYGNTSLLQ